MIRKRHADILAADFNCDLSAASMNDHIDFAFIHGNGNLAYDNRGKPQLFKHSLDVAGGFARACEIVARHVVRQFN